MKYDLYVIYWVCVIQFLYIWQYVQLVIPPC